MNVLIVGENVPNTLSGAAVASLGVVRAFRSGGWDVHLIVNALGWQLADLAPARALAASVVEVPRKRRRLTPVVDWVRCLARFGYFPRWQRNVLDAVEAALRERTFDLVVLDQIRAAEYGRLLKERGVTVPIALRAHNVEHELNDLLAPRMPSAQERAETRLRAKRYREIEEHLARYCDLVLPISEVDGAKLSALNPGLPCVAIPSPVDTDHYRPAPYPPPGKEICFVGGMGYGPNRDAVIWFVEEILPRVLERHPDARFVAVGEKPPEVVRTHPSVEAPGFVPDERVQVERCRVFVAPIRWGSGVRTKILNALAMRRPVVSTTIGIEGLHLAHGRSVLLADEPDAFAGEICSLLEDEARSAALAEAGLATCIAGYAPEQVALRIRAAYEAVAPETTR